MLFDHPAFEDHETVCFARDPESGLRAIIAVHSTRAGPSAGGVRYLSYPDDRAALDDVLRLSKGMTYKNIMAGLAIGGGKAVVIADPARPKSKALFRALGRCIHRLNGAYVGAEDVGVTTEDVAAMAEVTPHVAGRARGAHASGDPAPHTAKGVFLGLTATAKRRLGVTDLTSVRVGVLGLGAVGMRLADHLHNAGAKLVVADIDPQRVQAAHARFGAVAATVESLPLAAVDVFAPCALGGVLTRAVVERLQAKVVAGAANNQLAEPACDALLTERGILYAPDYVINAGGIINVEGEVLGRFDPAAAQATIERIPHTLEEIYATAADAGRPTGEVADEIARRRLAALTPAAARAA